VSFPRYITYTRQITVSGADNTGIIINLEERIGAPFGVTAQAVDNGIDIRWLNPLKRQEMITHVQSPVNTEDGVGANFNAHFHIAHRYTAEELLERGLVGMNIYKVDFVPMYIPPIEWAVGVENEAYTVGTGLAPDLRQLSNDKVTYYLKIFTPPSNEDNPAVNSFVHRQLATNLFFGEVNPVVLIDPITIMPGHDLWVAFEVIMADAGTVASVDTGSRVHGFGNLMRIETGDWSTIPEIINDPTYNFNWYILTHLSGEDQTVREISSRAFTHEYDIRRSLTTDVNHASAVDVRTQFASTDDMVTIRDNVGLANNTDYFYFVRARYSGIYGNKLSEWTISNKVRYTTVNEADITEPPSRMMLLGNFPNPFNPETVISFQLSVFGYQYVEIEVFNLRGQKVKSLVNDYFTAGNYSVVWDGRDDGGNVLGSGLYFYQMRAGDFTETRKMLLIK
jgi:hypothetical protein